jgi:5-methylcytosine-specific restriction enzyme subunit McrC
VTPARVTVDEHRSAEAVLSVADAAALAEVGAGRLEVTATAQRGVYKLRASQHVGSVTAGGVTVHVRPKVSIDNVLVLLGAAPEELHWWRDRLGYASYEELIPAFGAFFARVVERTLRRGLLRAYRPEQDRVRVLRGRIDFTEQLRRPGMETPIACVYDEFTADIALNRFLRAGIRRGMRMPGVDRVTRRLLMR